MKLTEIAIYAACYIISAFATTDILRLLKGASSSVLQPDSFCPVCNHKLSLIEQFPIISYFIRKGRCKYCYSKIPAANLYFEIFLSLILVLIVFFNHFSFCGYILSILSYEFVKFTAILCFGKREKDFAINLSFSLLQNIIIFTILGLLFIINAAISI